ncbi:peptidoglycan recognition protein family protein [Carnobacterium mobile]|uniref:peptidoglycan recognition protein family protein n=1 Tax=Carnobacterium mobile TaxID=2750 RepID=UPI0006909B09|nr:peptidoglycan-binding domain-containing protein [Carnobacterium mobile]
MGEVIKINRDDVINGIAGKRPGKPKGGVIHNDAGAMSAEAYLPWLISRKNRGQLPLGFAGYYGDRTTMLRVDNTNNKEWHTANPEGNTWFLGYEVVQSYYGIISDKDFLLNEDMVLRQVAEDFHFYGLKPNRNTVMLHKQFSSTTCPHRSWDLHGKSVNSVKDYFISKIAHYMSLGKTVEEMLKKEGVSAPAPTVPNTVTPQPDGKTLVVGKQAKQWETGSNIPAFVIGQRYDVLASKPVSKSRSKKAYLIGKGKVATGWLLEQDVEGFKTAGGGNTDKATPTTKPAITGTTTQSESVAGVQMFLNRWFYGKLEVDNKMGQATKKALIKALQMELNKQFKAGLNEDGAWGPKTENACITVRPGARGDISRLIQATLICKGYKVGGFDGIFLEGLEKAVKEFQRKNGLKVDGIVGKATFAALFR